MRNEQQAHIEDTIEKFSKTFEIFENIIKGNTIKIFLNINWDGNYFPKMMLLE